MKVRLLVLSSAKTFKQFGFENKFVFYYIKLASYIFNNQKIGNLRSRIDVRLSVSEMEQDFCKLYK